MNLLSQRLMMAAGAVALEIDYMEYASDAAAQAAWVTSSGPGIAAKSVILDIADNR